MKKEIELKYGLVSKDDFSLFECFLEQYRCAKKYTLHQHNMYFDTPSLSLKKNDISLRLRKQNGQFLLSAKQSLGKKAKHLSVRLEYEAPIESHIGLLIAEEKLSAIDAFSFLKVVSADDFLTKKTLYLHMKKASKTGLQIIGSFTNKRVSIPIELLNHQIEMELDHSIYPKDQEFYEVEVEFISETQANFLRPAIKALFRQAGLKTHRVSSKSSRLYKILYG